MLESPFVGLPKKVIYVGAVIFFVTFALQLVIWLTAGGYLDENLWLDVAVKISHGSFPGFDTPTPVHPGTSMLLVEAVFLKLPIDPRIAYHIGLSLLMAIIITCCALTAYLLRPKSLWWLCIVVLLAPNTVFPLATAPSAIATVLSVLFVLLLLRVREGSDDALAWLGICAGVLLADRIDTGVFFLATSFPYLWYIAKRRISITLSLAALFYIALDPYIFINAVAHVWWIYIQTSENRQTNAVFDFSRWSLFLPSIAFLFAFVYVFVRPRLSSLPRDFLLWLLAMSEALMILMLISHYHPSRYFLPVMSIGEIFLAIFALEYAAQEPSLKKITTHPEYLVVAFFVLSRAFRMTMNYAGTYAGFSLQEFILDTSASIMSHFL